MTDYDKWKSSGSSAKTRDHPLVDSSRHAHVVEVIFANLGELVRLIHLEHFASFGFRRLARFDPQSPGNVVETYKAFEPSHQ